MSWARLDDHANEHPKLHDAGPEACWLWACGLMYANRQKARDGFIPERMVGLLYPFKSPKRLAAKLVEVGLWEQVDGGYQVHDYKAWNKTKEQVEHDRAEGRRRAKESYERRHPKLLPPHEPTDSSLDSSDHSSAEDSAKNSDSSGVEWSGGGSGAGDSGSDAGARDPVSATMPVAVNPRNLAQALLVPIDVRARFVEENKHLAEWVQPEAWPEVRAVAATLHTASGGKGDPRLGKYASDTGIRRLVELYAAGFTQPELDDVCRRIVKDPWWTADGGKQRSLGALTVEVVRRATSAPGAVDHARRKAAEQPAAPYHAPVKPRRDDGPIAAPEEAQAAIAKVLGGLRR